MKIGFDNDKYLALQAEHIKERRSQFGDKLYLEFGGKLFDDYHASRVLPGFQPDSKIRMLATMKDDVEIVIAICAASPPPMPLSSVLPPWALRAISTIPLPAIPRMWRTSSPITA